MSEMVEKVARAIDPFAWKNQPKMPRRCEASLSSARAAIEAMREPTDEMEAAAYAHDDSGAQLSCAYDEIYTAMIDAALKE